MLSSAVTGSIGFPYQSAICASHHAINSIADSLRREVKPHGIDVVCLRPGIADRSFRKEWSSNVRDVDVFIKWTRLDGRNFMLIYVRPLLSI